jgi:hypothetical protein
MKRLKSIHSLWLLLSLAATPVIVAGQTSTRSYRGSLGEKHIEMRLNVVGNKVTGSYAYDQFLKEIQLEGTVDASGALQLTEGDGKVQTGKFTCQSDTEAYGLDLDCEWTKPDGSGRLMAFLHEQTVNLTGARKIVPKQVIDRKRSIHVSLPQLSAPAMTPAMNGFNRLVELKARKSMRGFLPVDPEDADFDGNYLVLYATDKFISVEVTESWYDGGAHPNETMWTINYDLVTNRELKFAELFKPGSGFKEAVANLAVKGINHRFDEIEKAEAARNKTQVTKRDEPFMTTDGLPPMTSWGLTSKGLAVYFDFPHVSAVFTKTVIPYSDLVSHFRPNGVAPPK